MGLDDSVASLKGVGAKTVSSLASCGIHTIYDLLTYFPFRYDDLHPIALAKLADQEKNVFKGQVIAPAVLTRFGPKKTRVLVRLKVEQAVVLVSFFNQPWLKSKFELDEQVAIFGKWEAKTKSVIGLKVIAENVLDQLAPIYSVTQNLKQAKLVSLIHQACSDYLSAVPELIPDFLRRHYHLLPEQQLIAWMHFPKTSQQANLAKRSASYREFFLFELGLLWLPRQTPLAGQQLNYDVTYLRRFIAALPFELTSAQKHVVNEICHDLKQAVPMNRLLQGDVGSGKTVVAAIALFAAVTAGYQGALMVPTEILATQHVKKLQKLMSSFGVKMALLTSNLKSSDKQKILQDLATGRLNLVVGTQALIQQNVVFKQLGLVVIDEQHRFGVKQRQVLKQKGKQPDVLAMTATPIPRTLALTSYGDMTISRLDELPRGRQPVKTEWLRSREEGKAWREIVTRLQQGDQVYVVVPLINESESVTLQNATALLEKIRTSLAPGWRAELLHGQLDNQQKQIIMGDFTQGKVAILVATTVIEVGIDVPTANTMVIYDADRFGLATLHQLRGRVGRGSEQAFCYLLADPTTDSGVTRLETLVHTHDGFKVAEADLKLRGQGDVLGQKQSGIPEFQVADPVQDVAILEAAHHDAAALLQQDSLLQNYPVLRHYLEYHQQ